MLRKENSMLSFTALEVLLQIVDIFRKILVEMVQVNIIQLGISIMVIYFIFYIIKGFGRGVY